MFIAKEPPELAYLNDESRCDQQEAIAQDLHLDGITDAALNHAPQNTESPYLDGYFDEVKRRIIAGDCVELHWKAQTNGAGPIAEFAEF